MRRLIFIITAILAAISILLYYPLSPETLPSAIQSMSPFPSTTPLSVTDPVTYSHYFYHSHRENEDGHFHVFVSDADQSIHAHLIGISLDKHRMPISLFVTAPWVTGEEVISADVLLNTFSLTDHTPENRWMKRLFDTYRNEIAQLLERRDAYRTPVFGRHEIIAEIKIQPSLHALSAETNQKE